MIRSEGTDSNSPTLLTTDGREIPRKVGETLAETYSRLGGSAIAWRVWERLLSEHEKQVFGNDFDSTYRSRGVLGMWEYVRAGSLESAVIDIAEGVDLISANRAAWLRREIGIRDSGKANASPKPVWDSARGELRLRDEVIRTVRINENPTNIQQVLDAFQAQFWPKSIENPLTLGVEQLYETLRSLNGKLSGLKFHAAGGGQKIFWELSDS
ncbi:MAG: hypothetical protein RH917_06555 [Lacipirellulaceae bacterium]